jgi:molybdenum cofactor cytidylyltransferase
MANEITPHVLVLAAGGSSRLGQPKQLVKLGGRTALHIVISQAVAVAGNAVTVVLGAHAGDITYLFQRSPVSYVVNRDWEEGMSSSIRAGIQSLPPACESVMILLGDQVAVTADDLRRLISAAQADERAIVAGAYAQTVGVPAIFPAAYFSELTQLRGARGARVLLKRHRDRVVRVPMPSAAIDLDTPEQLRALTHRFDADGPTADR